MIFDFLKKKRMIDTVELRSESVSAQMSISKKIKPKTGMQEIIDFEKQMEEGYNLAGKIDFKLMFDKPSRLSMGGPKNGKFYIEVGMQNYGDLENLNEKKRNNLYNTIVHELVHAKNYFNLTEKTQREINSNLGNIAHWGRLVLDEYSAYKEANELFPETEDELNAPQEKVLEAFTKMSKGILTSKTHGPADFYVAFYDYCSALITFSIVAEDFPKDKRNRAYVKSCNNFIEHLKEAYERMPLNYDEYKELGRILLSDLLDMVPYKNRDYFKYNTHMRMD